MRKILIIGCGSIGERHLRCFLSTNRVTAIACDKDEKLLSSMQENYQVPTTSDWETALQDPTVLAAVVSTPAHLHVPIAAGVLEAGKHVLIEKPLSINLEGTDRLRKLRDDKGLTAAVGYNYRSIPVVQAMRNFVSNGEFGTPLAAAVVGGQHLPQYRPAYKDVYFKDHATGGGAIQDCITHVVNAMEWIVGPFQNTFCDASHQSLEGITVEDTVNLVARSNRTMVNFAYNLFQGPNELTIDIHADKGSLRGEFHHQRWGVRAMGAEEWTYQKVATGGRDDVYITQANAFLDQIEGKVTQLASIEDGIQTLRVILAALESVKTGKMITINSTDK